MFFKPATINLGAVKVNNVDHLGSISFGSTEKIGRNVTAKKSQGFGQQMSDGTVQIMNIHYTLDDDILDHYSSKTNI